MFWRQSSRECLHPFVMINYRQSYCFTIVFWTEHRGVASLVYVKEGCLRTGDSFGFYHSNQKCVVQECGVLLPGLYPVDTLNAGQVGYFFGNIRNPHVIKIGDTLYLTE